MKSIFTTLISWPHFLERSLGFLIELNLPLFKLFAFLWKGKFLILNWFHRILVCFISYGVSIHFNWVGLNFQLTHIYATSLQHGLGLHSGLHCLFEGLQYTNLTHIHTGFVTVE